MPLSVQARFLRVLQEHEVMPVGSLKVIPVDIRVIAATNKDLKAMVEQKKFREDLYYRISVLTMRLPSLKERGDDIHLLIQHFLREKKPGTRTPGSGCRAGGNPIPRLTPLPGEHPATLQPGRARHGTVQGSRAGFRRCRPRSTYVREHNNRCSGKSSRAIQLVPPWQASRRNSSERHWSATAGTRQRQPRNWASVPAHCTAECKRLVFVALEFKAVIS